MWLWLCFLEIVEMVEMVIKCWWEKAEERKEGNK